MVETSRVVHVIFHRKVSKKVGKLPVPWKIMRMKITQTGLYIWRLKVNIQPATVQLNLNQI